MHIRLLTGADAPAYQQLRLASLAGSPIAFLSTLENEQQLHEVAFRKHLDAVYHPPLFGYFGLFMPPDTSTKTMGDAPATPDHTEAPTNEGDEVLVGYLQVSQTYLDKQKHIAFLNNLYLNPAWRGQGLAQYLFHHIFQVLQHNGQIERVFLSCTARNTPAIKLYRKLGFRRYAVRARAVKWQGGYDDEVEFVKILKE